MNYSIIIDAQGKTSLVRVTVLGDANEEVLLGQIELGTIDEAVARQYAEEIFLPDLRRNYPELASLVLPVDTPPDEE